MFGEPNLPTSERIAHHLQATGVLLPPTITAKFVAAHILSEMETINGTSDLSPDSMTILFLASNPRDQSWLDLEEELRSLEQEIRSTTFRDAVRLFAKSAVRPDDLVRYVREVSPNVIHFSGHGATEGILLRDDSEGYRVVEGRQLARFLEGRGVDLVVLNACHSEDQANSLSRVVRAVVGTTDAVEDESARRFTVAFYRALANGLSIREAFRDGTDAVALHGLNDVFHSTGDLSMALLGPGDG